MGSVNIPVFMTYVRAEFLHSHKQGVDYFEDATPFALSSHPGKFIELHIMSGGMTFNRIPLSAITNSKTSPRLDDSECSYMPCSSAHAHVIQYEHLSSIGSCGVWKKDGGLWQLGNYVFSIEWDDGNELHMIELEDGNYVAWDNSHITWGEDVPNELPIYGV